jgi:endonuclease/exonuclease/phosphatase family metal-dependent hydrolase
VTWNLHDGRGDLPRLVDDLASGRMTGAPVTNYVLLLQEVVVRLEATPPADLDVLAAARGLTVFHVPVFNGGPRPRGTAIVSSLPLGDTSAIDLPQERQHRVTAAATVQVNGRRLFVASAHFENRLDLFDGGPFADGARRRQAEALVDALPRGVPGIVGGDFNTMLGPSEPALGILRARFGDTPISSAQATFRGRLVLDHLFFHLPDGWRATRQVVAERYGSDHHPVIGLVSAG